MKYEQVYELVDQNVNDTRENKEKAAKAIHAFYFPQYKPLGELHKDEESCRKIAEHWAYKLESIKSYPSNLALLVSTGKGMLKREGVFIITHKGSIKAQGDCEVKNHFEFIDFIRQLGYSA